MQITRPDPTSPQLPHPFGEIALKGFYYQMVMVCHQAIAVTKPIEISNNLAQQAQKNNPVVFVDIFSPITAGSDVVERIWKFKSKRSGHGVNCSSKLGILNSRPDPIAIPST
ncbi:hypothetical protein [Methylicorpusculum oleiharenae]|uniref:hypothetical protein n=1 Tax=Methylicorpusculum oleiharenae TaxID=1338687 RepID=UPI002ED9BA06